MENPQNHGRLFIRSLMSTQDKDPSELVKHQADFLAADNKQQQQQHQQQQQQQQNIEPQR